MLLDCGAETPHNETTIEVEPNDRNHAIGGYLSYQLNFNGATLVERVVAAASVTFDGGQNWREIIPNVAPYQFNGDPGLALDRKSTRLNSSHQIISYAVFCLKKKTQYQLPTRPTHPHPRPRPVD